MSVETPKAPSEYEIKKAERETSSVLEDVKPKITPEPVPLEEERVAVSEVGVGEYRVSGGVVPEIELPASAGSLRLVRRVLSRPVGLQVGFEMTTIEATETGWYRFDFSEPFDEPPQVFVTIEYRDGTPIKVEYPKPTLTTPRISKPSISVPKYTFGTPYVDAKNYAEGIKNAANNVAIALLGITWGWTWDWLRAWFLAVYLSVTYFLSEALGNFWNNSIGYISSAIQTVMNGLKAIGDGVNSIASQIIDGINNLAAQTQNGFNETIGILKGYIDDSVTRAVVNLYKFSDLPMMKMNVGVIGTPTTTYVDVLGYQNSRIHVLAIGKRKRTLEDVIREAIERRTGKASIAEKEVKRGLFGLGLLPIGSEE